MQIASFKNLSALAAPYVIDNKDLLTNDAVKSVDIEKVGMFTYFVVNYKPVSEKQFSWLSYSLSKEKNYISSKITDSIEAKFLFPDDSSFITSILLYGDAELITKSILLENVFYWKENAFLVLGVTENEKPGLQ